MVIILPEYFPWFKKKKKNYCTGCVILLVDDVAAYVIFLMIWSKRRRPVVCTVVSATSWFALRLPQQLELLSHFLSHLFPSLSFFLTFFSRSRLKKDVLAMTRGGGHVLHRISCSNFQLERTNLTRVWHDRQREEHHGMLTKRSFSATIRGVRVVTTYMYRTEGGIGCRFIAKYQ